MNSVNNVRHDGTDLVLSLGSYKVGQMKYGPNGPSLPILVGTPGVDTNPITTWGWGLTGRTASFFTAFTGSTVAGVAPQILGVNFSAGVPVFAIDDAGNCGVFANMRLGAGLIASGSASIGGTISAASAVFAGPSSVASVAVGDGSFARSTSTGAWWLGGTSSVGACDWNITTSGMLSFTGNSSAFVPLKASAFNVSSHSSLKTNIQGVSNAMDVLRETKVARFNWVKGDDTTDLKTSILADQSPKEITGPNGDHFDLASGLAHCIQALVDLDTEFKAYKEAHP